MRDEIAETVVDWVEGERRSQSVTIIIESTVNAHAARRRGASALAPDSIPKCTSGMIRARIQPG